MKPILFYGHHSGEYKCFSNFYPVSFNLNNFNWSTSEQAFMSFKDPSMSYQKKIKNAINPYDAKKIGRLANLVPNWDQIKFEIMLKVLFAKFDQNPEIKEILLSTGNLQIHEDCNDKWWGGGPNYPQGKDLLGKALIKTRNKLREKE